MAVFKQKKVGFKPVSVRAQIGKEKMDSLSVLRARQEARIKTTQMTFVKNGRKALTKTINLSKAKEMIQTLKPSPRIAFEELLKEIKQNPSSSLEDIYVNVLRKLKSINPQEKYVVGNIERLYKASVKQGAIKIS
ncbi:MAG: hypothetical protein PHO61_04085 [Candidatus ainarchaeum sp.]|jgi:hypothetical protein|nr:hypothetical protein [Candidatus ainarchaeum sp.]HPM86237.1 hypothetical protein [archaeon]